MKKIDPTNQHQNRKNLRIIWSILLSLLVLLLYTGNGYSQSCSEKAKAKPTTAEILQKVANGNHLEKLQYMVEEHGANINEELENKESVLTLASYHGYTDLVSYLLQHGADIHLKNKWNVNAFGNACMQGNTEIAAMLLKAGADIDEVYYNGNTALLLALQKRHSKTAAMLIENGADITIANDNSQLPIQVAAWEGHPKVIYSLIEKGADVNYTTEYGNTLLHYLAQTDHPKSVAIALKKGADANITDPEGRLPLHNAAIEGNAEAVKLLLASTKDINLKEKLMGNTPLHIASINGDANTASLLLEAGADAGITNNNGEKPVYYAMKYGNTDVVSAFMEKKQATQKELAMAQKTAQKAVSGLDKEQAKISYTGHSGWIVQTPESVLVFDYWDKNLSSNNSLANGSFCCEEMKDKNVYVFVSHDHSDHFDPAIFKWAEDVKNINYIFGFEAEKSSRYKDSGYPGPKYHHIKDNQTEKIDNVSITTHKSNDTGQGFLVEIDGISVYHPGDHALFTDEDKPFFVQEVDFIAGIENQVDIAFLPVSGCPSRWKKEYIVEGFFYSIDKLHPQQVFPMHAFNNEYTLKEFAELADERKTQSEIVCVENRGDSFSYNKDLTASR